MTRPARQPRLLPTETARSPAGEEVEMPPTTAHRVGPPGSPGGEGAAPPPPPPPRGRPPPPPPQAPVNHPLPRPRRHSPTESASHGPLAAADERTTAPHGLPDEPQPE